MIVERRDLEQLDFDQDGSISAQDAARALANYREGILTDRSLLQAVGSAYPLSIKNYFGSQRGKFLLPAAGVGLVGGGLATKKLQGALAVSALAAGASLLMSSTSPRVNVAPDCVELAPFPFGYSDQIGRAHV